MSNPAIVAEGLGKRYRIGAAVRRHDSLRAAITEAIRTPLKNLAQVRRLSAFTGEEDDVFWALRDVSFEVNHGEVLGVIGRNGAGKSTLLKVLSRITGPSTGRAYVHGRVGSLLEVGTGFHSELTGRENVFLNGSILGMRKKQIEDRFDEIVAFSGVERFIDTPVKRYSSGMYLRLAFSVAAHLEPEVLLVDEVLAVGDAEFQKKCLGKMAEVAGEGRTVLFVSHNMAAVKRLCTAAIRITGGMIADRGTPEQVISSYYRDSLALASCVELPDPVHRVDSPLRIRTVEVLKGDGGPAEDIAFGDEIVVRLGVTASEPLPSVRVGIGIYVDGNRLTTLHTPPFRVHRGASLQHVACRLAPESLLPGLYDLHVGAHAAESGKGLDWVPDAISFNILPISADSEGLDEKELGVVRIPARWEGDLEPDEPVRVSAGAS